MDWNELRQKKQMILDDMTASIRYTPNRETDLLAFMRLYIKEDAEQRPDILEHLRCCIDGQPYPSPYAGQRSYTQEHVDRCDQLLEHYLDALCSCSDPKEAARLAGQTGEQLDKLDGECRGELIDDWRYNKLRQLIDAAAELAEQSCSMEQGMG